MANDFERIEYEIEIKKTEYRIDFSGKVNRGFVLKLVQAAQSKLKNFSIFSYLKEEEIVLPKKTFFLLLPKLNPIIDKVQSDVKKDSEKDWKTISRKVVEAKLKKLDNQYYSMKIIVIGDCFDC